MKGEISLASKDVSALRQRAVMYNFAGSSVFEPGNEEDTSIIPLPEGLKVIVATVNNDKDVIMSKIFAKIK